MTAEKIKMCSETQRYTVQASNERFAVMTKPFNARKTYLYCISDLQRGVRGPYNFIFGVPFEEELNTVEGAEKALALLVAGEMDVSYRHNRDLTEPEITQISKLHELVGA